MEFTGGCLCGAVRYRLTGPLSDVVVCHCTQCRRQTGHVSADTSVALERLQLERDTTLSWYRSSDRVERGFCRVCGSGDGRVTPRSSSAPARWTAPPA
jgi:hypothetical protein